ncbi:NUDIX hydrolase [Gimesia aquarii]|uniref:Nudix hydrolase domain-containing protein n=1 Tax=Gimesia aquarii TaxID=2527964 RepID=A0A517W299_9PLAN|nr:NUDIX domain-containing protein [Gimesia aquarii]QDT99389.1 hypothetical protein V144x_49000 [Gimesia aquarii]
MSDISVDLNGYRINLRVAAIVTRGADVLLCRFRGQDWWFLPGGRIKTNEDSHSALRRELTEEIGVGFEVIRPAVIVENFFDLDGTHFHEICTIYEVEWISDEIHSKEKSSSEIFEWIPRNGVSDINLKPDLIKKYIIKPNAHFELVIHREFSERD